MTEVLAVEWKTLGVPYFLSHIYFHATELRNTQMKSPKKSAKVLESTKVAPAPEQRADVGLQIGRVVRQLRESQGLTLAECAASADISPAMLSRMETGGVTPSLETLVSLAAALGVRPATLLQDIGEDSDSAQHVPAGRGLEVVRRGTRRGHTYHLLAAHRGPRKTFEPFLVTLTDKSETFPGFQHAGAEFIYILSGTIRYRHGTESYLLQPGDSLSFRGDIPHGPEKLEKVPIRMLSIIIYDSPQ
jgi:transcriptional regulator with XRE-family HTH domain